MARQRKKPGDSEAAHPKQPKAAPAAADEEFEVLEQARLLLEWAAMLVGHKSRWTRKVLARDRHSKPVSPSSERAVRFCVGGALLRAATEQLGLQLATNAREEREAEAVGNIEELDLPALTTAYRLLAQGFERLLLRPGGGRIREQRGEDGSLQPILVVPAAGIPTAKDKAARKKEIEHATSWSAIVHSFNDLPAVKHRHIRGALVLAQLMTYAEPAAAMQAPKQERKS